MPKSVLKTSGGSVAKPKKKLTWEPTLEHVRKFHDPLVSSGARRANLRIKQLTQWIASTQKRLDVTLKTGIDPQTKKPIVLTQENIKSVNKNIQNAKNEITNLKVNIKAIAQYSKFGKKVKKKKKVKKSKNGKSGKPTITAKEAIRRNTRILKGTDGKLYCVTKKRHFNSRPYWILCKKL
jgi:hypothetical protein